MVWGDAAFTARAERGRRFERTSAPPAPESVAAGAVWLLDEDPDLGRHLDADALRQARRLAVARVRTLSPGRWAATEDACGDPSLVAVLILEGVLVRRVAVGGRHNIELLSQGDVLRPCERE